MTKRVRSSVWNFFEKDDDPNYAMCLVSGCKTKIKQSCGNTSNLLKHLKAHQECMEEIKATTEKQKKKKQTDTQPTLQQTLVRTTLYLKESAKKQKIDNAVLEMIVTDLQPLSIVEDAGFKKLLETVDSRYQLPSRSTITRLPELYTDIKAKLQKQLDTTAHIALTTDIWTSANEVILLCHGSLYHQ